MEVKFDIVKPNLLVAVEGIYIDVPREQVIPFARDVDEVIQRNIGTLKVMGGDIGAVTHLSEKKRGTEMVPLSEYLTALEQLNPDDFRGITTAAYNLLGAGDYIINAWTPSEEEMLKDLMFLETKGLLRRLTGHLKSMKDIFGASIEEDGARKHLEGRLEELAGGVPDKIAHLWVVLGKAPSRYVKTFYDDRIAVGRIFLSGKGEGGEETINRTKEELVEKLKTYDGERLSLDVPSLMGQAYEIYRDGPALVARYGDILDSDDWRKRLIMLDE